jgi:Ca-activated chloride channel family protein
MFDFAGFELSDPWLLLTGLLAPFVFVKVNRRQASVAFSSLSLVAGGRRSLRERLVWLPAALLALAVLVLAIALAGPRTGNGQRSRASIAIMVVDRRSGSMKRGGLRPRRPRYRPPRRREAHLQGVREGRRRIGEGRPTT